jgi:hypothetical protein
MASYKKVHGINIKSYDEDPDRTYPSSAEGQLYYNASDGQIKFLGIGSGAWASGGNMNTARTYFSGSGSLTAGLAIAGLINGGTPMAARTVGFVESYDGSSWTEVGDANQARIHAGSSGTSTSSLVTGGVSYEPGSATLLSVNESWNGSSWTEVGDLNTGRHELGMSGTSTAALGSAGYAPPGLTKGEVESWNGSAWTETTDVNTAGKPIGVGTQTAALIIGRGSSAIVEQWNGSSWTEVGDLNLGRANINASGLSTNAVAFGGSSTTTETWDGTSWTETSDLSTGRRDMASANDSVTSGDSAFGAGGYVTGSGAVVNTEEWTVTHAFKKVTTS